MLDGTGLTGSFSDKNVLMISVDESKAVNKEKAVNTKKNLGYPYFMIDIR